MLFKDIWIILRSRSGYDNTYTCLSYLNSSDPIWKAEAEVFNVWRDQVWRKCHELLDRYMKGEIGEISFEELQKELPVIQWPSTEKGPEDTEPDVSEEEILPEQPEINETETELPEENSDSKKDTTETEKPVAEVTEEK